MPAAPAPAPIGEGGVATRLYNGAWQVLQTRRLEKQRSTTENTGPESLQHQFPYVWSERYIDAPILRDENTDSDGTYDDARV